MNASLFNPAINSIVPPNLNRLCLWECAHLLYRKRNGIEYLFQHRNGLHQTFLRFDNRNLLFPAFIHLPLILDALIGINRI